MSREVKGFARGRKLGVQIYFDPDQIEAVNAWRAREGNPSFNEAIRTLVEWGLDGSETEEGEA